MFNLFSSMKNHKNEKYIEIDKNLIDFKWILHEILAQW